MPFVGISFVMLLLSMAVGMPETLSYYQDNMEDALFAKEQVILSSTEDEDGNMIITAAKDAEKVSLTSLVRKSDTYNEEISVYSVEDDSTYIKLDRKYIENAGDDEVYISQAYVDKYGLKAGDTIVVSEKNEHKDYTWKVYGIYDYTAGVYVFMNNDRFNRAFVKDEDSFSGYL